MTRSILTIRPGARRARLALLSGLVAIALATVLAGQARADGYNRGPPRRGQEDYGHGHGRGPPPRYRGPGYGGYYRNPNMYYSAPPVMMYPPPGTSLNFIFPLFR